MTGVIRAPAGLFVQRNPDTTPTWALCQVGVALEGQDSTGHQSVPAMDAVTHEHRHAVTEYQRHGIALILIAPRKRQRTVGETVNPVPGGVLS